MFPRVVEQEAGGLNPTLGPTPFGQRGLGKFLKFPAKWGESHLLCEVTWGFTWERGLSHGGRAHGLHVSDLFCVLEPPTYWLRVLRVWGQTSAIRPKTLSDLASQNSLGLPLSLSPSVSAFIYLLRCFPSTSPNPPGLQGPGQVSRKPSITISQNIALQAECGPCPVWWSRLASPDCACKARGARPGACCPLAGWSVQAEGDRAGSPVGRQKLTW